MIQLHHSYMICTGTYVLALLLSARHTLFPFHDKMSPTWQCLESFGSSKIHSFSCIHDYQNKHCVYSVVSQTRWPWTNLRISSQGNQSGHLFLHQIFPKMYLQTKSYRKHSLIKVFSHTHLYINQEPSKTAPTFLKPIGKTKPLLQ